MSRTTVRLWHDVQTHDLLVKQVKAASCEDCWRLQAGDLVFLAAKTRPHRVMRCGYAEYGKMVRVAGLREDARRFETGWWDMEGACIKLEVDDILEAKIDTEDCFEPRQLIPRGSLCRYLGRDNDGDVEIALFGHQRLVLFLEELDNMVLHG